MHLSNILFTAANAILPILLLILLGYILKRKQFLSREFLTLGNKLVFNICLPAMLFVNIYDIEGFAAIQWDVVIYSVAAVCLLYALSFIPALTATKDPLRKGVVMQCVFRSNFAIIGIPLATALGGAEAAGVTAVISAFSIPVFNIFAVLSLTMFMRDAGGKKPDFRSVLRNIAKNPLIIGVVLGLICLGIRQAQLELWGDVVFALNRETKFLYTVLTNLKGITTPLALIVLGGQFEFSAVKGMFKEIVSGTVWRTVLAPLIGVGLAVVLTKFTPLLNCGPYEYPALVALFGSPVAVSSAVMAAGMKNDGQLAAQLVVWTSFVSIFTVFATICIMMPMGLLTP